jgi:hypothetical protein
MLKFSRKPWQWMKEIGLGRNEIIKIIFYCNGKNMEIAIFSAFWQKPPKAKENLAKMQRK